MCDCAQNLCVCHNFFVFSRDPIMPPTLLVNISKIDLAKTVFDREAIAEVNPQSYEMSQLDGIIWHSLEEMKVVGYKDITENEFWIRGHIPGRPIMPGVIMVEAAAQVSSFFMKKIYGLKGFIGFSGIDNAKFRETVIPGNRFYLIAHICKVRSRQFSADVQGLVNNKMVFDTRVTGMIVDKDYD